MPVLSTFQKITQIGPCFHHYKIIPNRCVAQRMYSMIYKTQSVIENDEDYQYMKKSFIPTNHFQESLPHLPIPKLEETCERYLRAQKPLLDSKKHEDTKLRVKEFLKKEGAHCQKILVEEDKVNKRTSYISKPWFDMYLSERRPLPINFNPFLVFVRSEREVFNDQLIKATNLVISSLRFYKALHSEILEPEVYHMNPSKSNLLLFKATGLLPKSISWYGAYLLKAFPLDMSQYSNLFNTTRVPHAGKDQIKHTDEKKHILVMKGGNFYVFDVLDEIGNIKPPNEIFSAIKSILESSDPPAKQSVGVLTTENRDEWASARRHLESLGNSEVLELIDSSLFNLALDDSGPGDSLVRMVKVFLHADGRNRWFDKSFSLIVTQDGYAGINFEHSWGDGVAVLRYFNEIHEDSTSNPRVDNTTVAKNTPTVRKLEFNLDVTMESSIYEAQKNFERTINALEVRGLEYHKFGRKLCKPLNISPDALMQLAFQMAYDKLAGEQVATYESCSTAAFKHGRTETVRPCTIETQEMCHILRNQNDKPSREQLKHMVMKCSEVHTRLIKEAAMGNGFDRHLFALKVKCDEMGLMPDLFNDPAYEAINHNTLSTSTLASNNLLMGAFGPVVQDGYGIGYSIWNDRLGTIVTSYAGHSKGEDFIKALSESLDTLEYILRP